MCKHGWLDILHFSKRPYTFTFITHPFDSAMKNKTIRTVFATLLCSQLGMGCSGTPIKLPVPFDRQQALAQLGNGTNQITGTILYEPDHGRVLAYPDTFVSCAGRDVLLLPYTDFAREWALQYYGKPVTDMAYRLSHRGRSVTIEGQDAFFSASRKTRCDEKGNFSFNNIADGEFLLVAKVKWLGKDEEAYNFGFAPEDIDEEEGSIVKRITLSDSERQVLTGPWP